MAWFGIVDNETGERQVVSGRRGEDAPGGYEGPRYTITPLTGPPTEFHELVGDKLIIQSKRKQLAKRRVKTLEARVEKLEDLLAAMAAHVGMELPPENEPPAADTDPSS